MAEIIDKSYNRESGELVQFTIIDSSGQPQLVKATAENCLLYDPEDELAFEDGMYEFLSGEKAIILSEDNPEVIVAPTNNEYTYILRVRGNTVETTPKQAETVLEGIKAAVTENEVASLVSLYEQIISSQVRRGVINALLETFDEQGRITSTERGWFVDDFYLVNWEASMYTSHNDPDKPDKIRGGGGVKTADRSYEFVQLNIQDKDIEPVTVMIQGEKYRLTEREMLFLAKVKWLLGRREYHPDMVFWKFNDRYASVDWKTGNPVVEDVDSDAEPDKDTFKL